MTIVNHPLARRLHPTARRKRKEGKSQPRKIRLAGQEKTERCNTKVQIERDTERRERKRKKERKRRALLSFTSLNDNGVRVSK